MELTNGVALLSELNTVQHQSILNKMRDFELNFLNKKESFRDENYKWPGTAVNNWSRIWEYPKTFSFINKYVNINKGQDFKIVDFGSGITFFPYFMSTQLSNVEIYTVDNDTVCVEGNLKAASVFKAPIIPILTNDGSSINLPDNSVDIVYSVSVIEHLSNYKEILFEITRILKPGGLFVVTFDLDLRGDFALNKKQFNTLLSIIENDFEVFQNNKISHPLDILNSVNSPVQSEKRSIPGRIKGFLLDIFNNKLRSDFHDYKLYLSCFGGGFIKK